MKEACGMERLPHLDGSVEDSLEGGVLREAWGRRHGKEACEGSVREAGEGPGKEEIHRHQCRRLTPGYGSQGFTRDAWRAVPSLATLHNMDLVP